MRLIMDDGITCIYNADNIVKIIFPEGKEKITKADLPDVTSLKEVVLPPSVKEIEEDTFGGSSLEKINLENVEKIGDYAFYKCKNLKEIELPSIKEIGINAFENSGLEKISLKNIEKIKNCAFIRCKKLKEAKLFSVKEIGINAFKGSGLEKISLENVEKIGRYAFKYSGLEKINLENVERIGEDAFSWCQNLKEVTLSSVKEIGEYAFRGSGLEKINLENVEKIGDYAFIRCKKLKEAKLFSVKEIGRYAFKYSGLEKINLENVKKFEFDTFDKSGIKKIIIPDGAEVSGHEKPAIHNGILYYFNEISNKISQACGLNIFDQIMLDFMIEKYAILKGMTYDKMFDELCRGEHISFLKFMGDTAHRNPSNEQIEKMIDDFFLGASVFKNKTYQESSIDHAKEAFKQKFHGHYPKIIETIALYADHNVYTIEDIVNKFDVSDMKNIIDKTDTWGEALTCMMSTDKSERASFLNNPYQGVITKLYVEAATLNEDEREHVREHVHAVAKWVMSHKSASNKLINDIEKYGRYLNINEASTVAEINAQINNTLGLFEMQNIEKDYQDVNFSFSDLQYNLKHSSVTIEGRTARTLQKGEEALMVRLGYLTSCCQHLNGAGETAMMHGLINPNAGFWVIEDEKGQVIAQAEIWEKDKDTIIFDNIEFANDRELKDIQKVLTSWVESSQYKNVIMGCGYNELSSSINLQKSEAQYPELTAEEIYMLQDEDEYVSMEDARDMAESGDYDYDDFVYTDADEHCVWLKKNGVVDSALYGNWVNEGEDYDDIGDDEEIGG